jgi:hypothetical protein
VPTFAAYPIGMPHETRTYRRSELYEQVWARPMREVAKEYGVSDVALAKTCRKLAVPVPGVGYWARKRAGGRTHRAALPPLPEGVTEEMTVQVWTEDPVPLSPEVQVALTSLPPAGARWRPRGGIGIERIEMTPRHAARVASVALRAPCATRALIVTRPWNGSLAAPEGGHVSCSLGGSRLVTGNSRSNRPCRDPSCRCGSGSTAGRGCGCRQLDRGGGEHLPESRK